MGLFWCEFVKIISHIDLYCSHTFLNKQSVVVCLENGFWGSIFHLRKQILISPEIWVNELIKINQSINSPLTVWSTRYLQSHINSPWYVFWGLLGFLRFLHPAYQILSWAVLFAICLCILILNNNKELAFLFQGLR